jgi:hypothetical protein
MAMTMNGVWSAPPAGRITRLGELGDLSEKISEGAGESSYVCKLGRYPGWLYKKYRAPRSAESARRLDQLIGLPGQMSGQDQSVVDEHTAWPAARVVDAASRTTGVLLPMAPEAYKFQPKTPTGRTVEKFLEVDLLALSGSRQRQIGLPPQSLTHRIAVCTSIATAADLLERYGLVYLDWSYANIFWRPADHSAYLIDLDGTSFGPRPQIQTPQWDDPLVPLGTTAGNSSDRYRVALLITTCLTGKRVHDAEARTDLGELRAQSAEVEQLAELLLMALTAGVPSARPAIARIKAALDAANGPAPAASTSSLRDSRAAATSGRGGVDSWKPIQRASAASTPRASRPEEPAPSTPRPSAPSSTTPFASPTPRVPVNTSYRGGGPTTNGTGPGIAPQYRNQPPARPPSSTVPVAVKTALVIVALIIICVIIANL